MLYHPSGQGGWAEDMLLKITDFNGADATIAGGFHDEWSELEQVLGTMPLHLKASDQDGLQGNPIFDVVGTNQHVAQGLVAHGWAGGIPIPADYRFLGKDVDFGKHGMIVEVQFSNYPFLLNNLLRSELFFRSQTVFHKAPTRIVVIVTKSGMFPSSNSTLYYEQAVSQLTPLAKHQVFTVPVRLVGLFENVGKVQATWTDYSAKRYSRTVGSRDTKTFTIVGGAGNKCRIAPPDDLFQL